MEAHYERSWSNKTLKAKLYLHYVIINKKYQSILYELLFSSRTKIKIGFLKPIQAYLPVCYRNKSSNLLIKNE